MTVTLGGLSRRLPILAVLIGLLVALAGAPSALAAGGSAALLRDCQDGTISGKYSQGDYAKALRDIPTDVDEYTDCRSVIRRAQLGAAGGGTSSGGTGGSTGAGGAITGVGGTGAGSGAGSGASGGTAGGAATGGGDATASGPTTAATALKGASAQERAGVAAARAGATAAPVQIGGREIRPAQLVAGTDLSKASLPTPVLLSLIALGLAAIAALALWTKGRVDARRTAGA